MPKRRVEREEARVLVLKHVEMYVSLGEVGDLAIAVPDPP